MAKMMQKPSFPAKKAAPAAKVPPVKGIADGGPAAKDVNDLKAHGKKRFGIKY
jgi:hypothetical protein